MKKLFKNFMALSLGLALVATACSKDETDAEIIAGNYVGTLSMAENPVATDVAIAITAKNDNTVTLALNTTLPNLPGVGNLPLNVACESPVVKSGDNYTLSTNTTVSIPISETPLPLTISGTITPAGQANLTITITMGVSITVTYSGAKQ
jgi:hypothetical protein